MLPLTPLSAVILANVQLRNHTYVHIYYLAMCVVSLFTMY